MNKVVNMIHAASVSGWIMTLASHRRGSAIRTSLFMPVLFPSHGDVAPVRQCIDWLNIAKSRVVLTNRVPL